MSRGRRPEEFFEVFREVQETKKRQDETSALDPAPREAEPPRAEAPGMDLADREPLVDRLSEFFARTVTVSYTIVATSVVAVILLLMAFYMLGKQSGWASYAATVKSGSQEQGGEQKPGDSVPKAAATGPELVDGKIFTLLTGDRTPVSRESVEKEVEHLNALSSFTRLGLEAYVYEDEAGRYRLAARGLAALDASRRGDVIETVSRMKSSRGRSEYTGAALYAP